MMNLSEAQKAALYRAANRVKSRIINGDGDENEAWNRDSLGSEHKGTLSALYTKGLTTLDDHLTMMGITEAKAIWNKSEEAERYGEWSVHIANRIQEDAERAGVVEADRAAWKEYVATLPTPDGYKVFGSGNLSFEWRPEEFAKMPSILIEDRNAPYFGHVRYDAPEWLIQCNGVGPMELETVNQFRKALDLATEILSTLEERYKDVEVKEI